MKRNEINGRGFHRLWRWEMALHHISLFLSRWRTAKKRRYIWYQLGFFWRPFAWWSEGAGRSGDSIRDSLTDSLRIFAGLLKQEKDSRSCLALETLCAFFYPFWWPDLWSNLRDSWRCLMDEAVEILPRFKHTNSIAVFTNWQRFFRDAWRWQIYFCIAYPIGNLILKA